MTNVITMASRKASPSPATTVITTTPAVGIERQQAIENALSMALYHVRHCDSLHGLQAATSKAIRATSMLKQACAESTIVGKV